MLSKTLEDGLSKCGVGERLRTLRLRMKLGLVDLGKHTGLSPALLSKLETGKWFPTLPTLVRIAMVFNVGLEHFFASAESGPVLGIVRRGNRLRLRPHPAPTDHHRQPFDQRADLLEGEAARTQDDGRPELDHGDSGLSQALAGLLAALQVAGERVALVPEAAEVNDPAHPGVPRRADILAELASELESRHGIKARVVPSDLAQPDGIDQVVAATEDLPIGLLVAAAGFGTSGRFIDATLSDELDMIDVNCRAVAALSHAFGRRFAKQGRGGLVLMSSLAEGLRLEPAPSGPRIS